MAKRKDKPEAPTAFSGVANLTPFKPGASGNPSGKPKGYAEFKELCRTDAKAAQDTVRANLHDDDASVRHRAAELILAYAWGKPTQAVEMTGADGAAQVIQILTLPKE